MIGTVYFVECAGRIKIGHSKDAPKRIRSLRTGAPDVLKILATVPGSRNFEQAIHKELAQWRVRLEWFEDRPSVRLLMERIVSEGYEAIGFVEPQRQPLAPPPEEIAVLKRCERLLDTDDKLASIVERHDKAISLLERLTFTRRLEMLAGIKFGSLLSLIADGECTKEALGRGIDIVEKATHHLNVITEQASLFREENNELVLAQAEGIVLLADRSLQDLFKFRNIWGNKGETNERDTGT